MRRIAVLIPILLLVAAIAGGQTVQKADQAATGVAEITLSGFQPNKIYTIEIRTDAGGKIASIGSVTLPPRLDVETLTIRDPDGPPPQSDIKQRTRAVVAALNDPATARDLAVAYSVVLLRSDSFSSVAEIGRAAADVRSGILQSRGVVAKWKPFSDFVAAEFVKAAQESRADTVAEYATVLSAIRDGLLSDPATTQEAVDLQGILQLVQLVLSFLQGDEPLTLAAILKIVMAVIEIFTSFGMEVST